MLVDVPSSSFMDRFEWLLSKVLRDDLRTICALACAARYCLNKFILEQEISDPQSPMVACSFVKLVADYREYMRARC